MLVRDGAVRFGEGRSMLIFDHINRCAGGSFMRILHKAFGPHYHGAGWPADWFALAARRDELFRETNKVAVVGHCAGGVHELFDPAIHFFYLTFLRDPVAVTLSKYRLQLDLYAHAANLYDTLKGCESNSLTRWLADGDLELAKKRLSEDYCFVGIVERFNESVLNLGRLLGMELAVDGRENVSPQEVAPAREVIELIRALNWKDLELYAFALELWEQRGASAPAAPSAPGAGRKRTYFATSSAITKHLRNGALRQAIPLLEAAAEHSDLNRLALARTYLDNGDLDKAKDAYETLYARNPLYFLPLTSHEYGRLDPAGLRQIAAATVERCEALPTRAAYSKFNDNRVQYLACLAEAEYLLGNAEEAGRLFETACERAGWTWPAVRLLAQFLRRAGRFQDALRALLAVPEQRRELDFYFEILVVLHLTGGYAAVADFLARTRDTPGAGLARFGRFDRLAYADYPRHALADLARPGGRCLILRAAPMLVVDDALTKLTALGRGVAIDLVAQEECRIEAGAPVDRVFRVANGRFLAKQAAEAVDPRVFATRYDTVFIPMSNATMDSYRQFAAFAQALTAATVAYYPLTNVFFPLEETGGYEVPTQTPTQSEPEQRP